MSLSLDLFRLRARARTRNRNIRTLTVRGAVIRAWRRAPTSLRPGPQGRKPAFPLPCPSQRKHWLRRGILKSSSPVLPSDERKKRKKGEKRPTASPPLCVHLESNWWQATRFHPGTPGRQKQLRWSSLAPSVFKSDPRRSLLSSRWTWQPDLRADDRWQGGKQRPARLAPLETRNCPVGYPDG